MQIKTRQQIDVIKKNAMLLSRLHGVIATYVKPGITTRELDQVAEKYIQDHGGRPAFKGINGYRYTICASVNEELLHGEPSNYVLKEGDIVSIDMGIKMDGWCTDSAYTHTVGKVSEKALHLLAVTEQALLKGIAEVQVGKYTGDIGYAIQQCIENAGYSVAPGYAGHGIGKKVHEDPMVPNQGKPGAGKPIEEGMVLCVEPLVMMGKAELVELPHVVVSKDRSLTAHFEHMVAVVNGEPELLTTFDFIKKEKQENG